MLAGAGTIATVLVLATQAGRDVRRLLVLAMVLASIYAISWPILHGNNRLIIGEGKVGIITHVLGLILAARTAQPMPSRL
jgi:multiple antibiotic resistance protein